MDQVCVLPHRQDPDRPRRAVDGLLVCVGCADRIGRTLLDLPRLHADLEHVLAGTWRDRVGDDTWPLAIAENPLPLQPRVAEQREVIRHRLVSWAVMVAEERGEHVPSVPLAGVARWLHVRHGWSLGQAWVEDYAAELTEARGPALAMLDPSGVRRVPCGPCRQHVEGPAVEGGAWPVQCPGTLVALVGKEPEMRVDPTCDGCGEVVTLDHHAALRRGLTALLDTQAAAEMLGVSRSAITMWSTRGKIRPEGRDAQGRALWRLETLERLKREDGRVGARPRVA